MYKNIKIDPPVPQNTRIMIWEPTQVVENWNYSRNIVQHWRFYMNSSSGALINGTPVPTDRILLIPPGILLTLSNQKPFSHFYIHFETGPLYNSAAREIYAFPREDFGTLPEQLLRLTGEEELEYIRTLLYAAIFSALRMIPAENLHTREQNMDGRIASARDYILQHLGEKLVNSALARRAGISTNRFIRLFRDELGVPPQLYQQYQRVQQAMNYLSEQAYSIDEIADMLGFADRFHFSRVFTRVTGTPPGTYRRYHREENGKNLQKTSEQFCFAGELREKLKKLKTPDEFEKNW